MLSKLSIAQKIYFAGFVQFLLIFTMGMTCIHQMNKIGKELFEIAEENIPLTQKVTVITEHQLELAILLERIFFKAALALQGHPDAQMVLEKNITLLKSLEEQTYEEIKAAELFIESAIDKLHYESTKVKYHEFLSTLAQIDEQFTQQKQRVMQAVDMGLSGNMTSMIKSAKVIEETNDVMDKKLIQLLEGIQDFTQASALRAEEDEKLAIKLIAALFAVATVILILLPLIVSRSIVSPILKLIDRLKQIADGDGDLRLRLDVSARDETSEVAKSFNRFMDVLNNVIKGVSHQADSLGQSAEVGLRAMEVTLENVETQREETEAVAVAVEQMSATTNEVASNTHNASRVAALVKERVNIGRETAQETQNIISQLANEVDTASEVMACLMVETNNIGSVTETIQSIAEQTNLLALNAAIEAARAGESGRGFAVVADEVRSLAKRTRESTVSIQELVQRLQNEANNAVETMARGAESTRECLMKGKETTAAFDDASHSVSEITDLNEHIAAASEQQAIVSKEINQALNNITDIAEQTSSGAKKTAEAHDNMAKRLIDLHTNINVFQIDKLSNSQ